MTVDDFVREGRAALRNGDTAVAREAFEAALEVTETGPALEGLAETMYLQVQYEAAAKLYERAFSVYAQEPDRLAAGRTARAAAWIHGGVFGNWAVESGWQARARTLLEEAGDEGPERGWVLILRSHAELDPTARERDLRAAIEIGRRYRDPNIEFEALGYLGALFLLTDRVDEGLGCLDEALSAVCAGEVDEVAVIDSMFCGFFWACERVTDVVRAEQWMQTASAMFERRSIAAAFCRAHYAGILTAAGRWPEAEAELTEAGRQFDRSHASAHPFVLLRLANLRYQQGRLEEATQLLEGLDQDPGAIGILAALRLARGETVAARDLLQRATAQPDDEMPTVGEFSSTGPLLALLVDVYLAEGSVADAASASERLDRMASQQRSEYLKAVAALASGKVCIAAGSAKARDCIERALAGFARAQLPLELARARLELARAVASDVPEVAISEATIACDAFERLAATRDADAAAAFLRTLGVRRVGAKGSDALTKREGEVLVLLGRGLSNPEIADRLYISRKTVEHHVGRVLAKLGLRSRAEAAAHAARTGSAEIRP